MTSEGTITCPDCKGGNPGNYGCYRCLGSGEIPIPARKLTLNPPGRAGMKIAREQSRALQYAHAACWACGATVEADAVSWPGFTATLALHPKCVRKVAESATRRADKLEGVPS